MNKQLKQVKEFHEAYGGGDPTSPTTDISDDVKNLRVKLIEEEFEEVKEAILDGQDIKDLAKELADLLYVVYGTIEAFGLSEKMEEVFDEVHRSNMSKFENGKPVRRADGKTLKGKNYIPADLSPILD